MANPTTATTHPAAGTPEQVYAICRQVEEASHRVKRLREFLDMWLSLIPDDEECEGESLRVGIVMDQIIEALSCLEKAEAIGSTRPGGGK